MGVAVSGFLLCRLVCAWCAASNSQTKGKRYDQAHAFAHHPSRSDSTYLGGALQFGGHGLRGKPGGALCAVSPQGMGFQLGENALAHFRGHRTNPQRI